MVGRVSSRSEAGEIAELQQQKNLDDQYEFGQLSDHEVSGANFSAGLRFAERGGRDFFSQLLSGCRLLRIG